MAWTAEQVVAYDGPTAAERTCPWRSKLSLWVSLWAIPRAHPARLGCQRQGSLGQSKGNRTEDMLTLMPHRPVHDQAPPLQPRHRSRSSRRSSTTSTELITDQHRRHVTLADKAGRIQSTRKHAGPEDLRMDLDDLLIGHWSSLPFSYGVMEASELGLLSNGRGWSSWFNVFGLCVTRFSWGCPQPGVLELQAHWMVEGTPSQSAGSPTFSSMGSPERWDEVTRHHYRIGPAVPLPGAEALMAVSFEEPVEFCFQYARGSTQIRAEEDPTHVVVPYQQ